MSFLLFTIVALHVATELFVRYKPSNQNRDEMKRAVLHGNTSYMIQSCHYSSWIGC